MGQSDHAEREFESTSVNTDVPGEVSASPAANDDGAFYPRRRRFRREEDRDKAFIDWYPPHLLFAAIAIMCLSVADGLFTVHLINAGATEMNPLLAVVVNDRSGSHSPRSC